MHKQGFAFIEVLSPCPTGFGRPNDRGDGLEDMRRYRQRCIIDDNAYLPEIDIDSMDDTKPIVVGNFVNVDRPPFHPVLGAPRQEVAEAMAESVNERTRSRESIGHDH
jgi:2-oxoglutarate ferredoxin oxidoreductase subunit beta